MGHRREAYPTGKACGHCGGRIISQPHLRAEERRPKCSSCGKGAAPSPQPKRQAFIVVLDVPRGLSDADAVGNLETILRTSWPFVGSNADVHKVKEERGTR